MLILLLAAGCGYLPGTGNGESGTPPAGNVRIITSDGKTVYLQAEYAVTPESQEKGLSNRQSMPENNGMIFIFPQEGQLAFWMKDTFIPLSIAFVAKDGRIVDIQDMQPQTLDYHIPPTPYMYALEVNQGWFKRHGVRVGDRLEFDKPVN
jgi:uncharacterized membrane protein (UPF0127 family)